MQEGGGEAQASCYAGEGESVLFILHYTVIFIARLHPKHHTKQHNHQLAPPKPLAEGRVYLTSIQPSGDFICILLPPYYSPSQNYGGNSGIKMKGAKRVKRRALSCRPYCFPSTPTPSHCIK